METISEHARTQVRIGEMASEALGVDRGDCVDAVYWILLRTDGAEAEYAPGRLLPVVRAIAAWLDDARLATEARGIVAAWNWEVSTSADPMVHIWRWLGDERGMIRA